VGSTRTIIGVDIGGTKVAAALLRLSLPPDELPASGRAHLPQIISRATLPTDVSSEEACLAGIAACIARVMTGERAVEAIGVGIASLMDTARGLAVHSVHLPLTNAPVRDVLEHRLGLPVAVDNDATVACIGEHMFGAGAGARDMLMLTLGTGVGGGIICDGRPYRGACGAAGELGHVMVDVDGPACPGDCPNRGCLEAYVSGTAMSAVAMAAAQAHPSSALGRALQAGETVDSRLLSRLALDGDADAGAILSRLGDYLGTGLTTLVNIFNPEIIVIGGGAAAAGDLLLEPARRVLAQRALRPARDQVLVLPALLGADAGMIGAAALALIELFPEGTDHGVAAGTGPVLTSSPPSR
jgi:glucokinase